ncbi:MAG: addiction module antidote protein [Chromatiaceae bacterium]|jgi:probable addiction module antidote protein
MTEQFSRWDSTAYLNSDDDIAAYLDACFEEAGNDPGFITRALNNIVRAKGLSTVAEQAGLAADDLGRLLSSGSNPQFGEILRVIHALGLRLHAEKAA